MNDIAKEMADAGAEHYQYEHDNNDRQDQNQGVFYPSLPPLVGIAKHFGSFRGIVRLSTQIITKF